MAKKSLKTTNQQSKSETKEILYDSRESQIIPLNVFNGSQQVRVLHHIKPLSNERYFQFDDEVEMVNATSVKI